MQPDPFRQKKQLQQALAADKMPIGFLLGAGCPCSIRVDGAEGTEPLIPAVAGLTSAVCQTLETEEESRSSYARLCAQFAEDEESSPNIERILGRIRSLREVAGKGVVRELSANQLEQLDQRICRKIDEMVRRELPPGNTPYHSLASWIQAIPTREFPVEVFTTNYDLLMEQALEHQRVPYFDGFVGSNRTFFDVSSIEQDRLPPRWARLWKLHGSINWRQSATKVVSRGEKFNEGERRLIHPSHLKYDESRRMPYLAMMDRLRAFFRRSPAILVTCGFSFSDQHLNEVLQQGLEGNPTATCFALMHGKWESYEQAVQLASLRANLNLLAVDGAVIGRRRGQWVNPEQAGAAMAFELGDFVKFGEFLAGEIVGGWEKGSPPYAS